MTDRKFWQTSVSVYSKDFSSKRIEELSKAGIKHIELTTLFHEEFAALSEHLPEFIDIAAASNVKIRSIHLPFAPNQEFDPANSDKAVRDFYVETQSRFVEAAGNCGIEIAVIHPSCEPYDEDTRNRNLEFSIQSLNEIQKAADDCGIKLAIENLPRTCIGRDCSEMKHILDSVDGAYACFDSNHSLYSSNIDMIKAMGSKIIATHISDYDFIDERHLFPGLGKNDWEAIMQALEYVGYSGTWNYEIRDSNSYSAEIYKLNHTKLLDGRIK